MRNWIIKASACLLAAAMLVAGGYLAAAEQPAAETMCIMPPATEMF